jgi:hypothetical protein
MFGPLEELTSITEQSMSYVIEVSSFCCTQHCGCLLPLHLRMEADPVSETLCLLECWMGSKNSVIPLSEPFQMYLSFLQKRMDH